MHQVLPSRLSPVEVNLVEQQLLDPEAYPADERVELGRGRWSAELNIRHLKTTMGMEILKCKTIQGVLKELAIFLLVYNLVRAVMLNASACQCVPPDRISFADALAWIRLTLQSGDCYQRVSPVGFALQADENSPPPAAFWSAHRRR